MISDRSGGAILTWYDYRFNPRFTIFAQRINSNGITLWIDEANQVFSSPVNGEPSITSDGNGGAYITAVTGSDFGSLHAHHINSNGELLWGEDGIIICPLTVWGSEASAITGDGNGGAIMAWMDRRNNADIHDYDIYAQRINSSGLIQWAANGLPVTNAAGYQGSLQMENDGSGTPPSLFPYTYHAAFSDS